MTRHSARPQHRLLERLFWLLGISQRQERAWSPIESLEPRTLMSIAALNSAVQNATGIFDEDMPRIAANASGTYVVVWSTGGLAGGGVGNDGHLQFSLFDHNDAAIASTVDVTSHLARGVPAGSPGATAVTSLDHASYGVAINPSGNFVIVWEDDTDIMAQRYDATGTPVGSAINVSQGGSLNQTVPSVAMDAAGDFAVTWLSDQSVIVNVKTMTPKSYYDYVDTNTNKVKRSTTAAATDTVPNSFPTSVVMARRFDATGSGGSAITVSPAAANTVGSSQTTVYTTNLNPGIAMDSAGDFAVAWDANGYAPNKTLGTPLSKTTSQDTIYDTNNNPHTVTLHSYTGPTFYYDMGLTAGKLMVQRFDSAGTQVGSAITALTKASSASSGTLVAEDASIAMDGAGDFAVAGAVQYIKSKVHTNTGTGDTSNYYATSSALSVRRFSAAAKAGTEIKVLSKGFTPFFSGSPIESPQITNSSVAMDSTGNMMVTWDQAAYDLGSTDVKSTGVFARRYGPTGTAQETAPFQIGAGTITGSVFPHVAFSGGLIDIAYNNNGNLFTQRFRPVLAASKVVFSTQPVTGGPGELPEVDVQVLDANGFVDSTNTSTVTLSIFSGTKGAKLTGTTAVKAVNGVAAFTNLSLLRGGNYVLKASDSKLTTATSSSFQIITTPTHLAFTTIPKSITAGVSPTIVVSVEDANGDVAVGDGSTVTLSAGTGSLLGVTTAIAVHGLATFSNSFVIAAVGSYTLQATDGALTSATSPALTVTPAHAAIFSFNIAPADTTAGTKFNIQVTARDIFSNLATLDHSKITLTPFPAGSTVASMITGTHIVTLNKGVASFTGISVTTAGTHTLTASNVNTSATSSSFIVSPAAASKLVFAQAPNAVTGNVINPAVVVDVTDKFGNIVPTTNGAVTLTVASAPSGAAAPTGTLVQNTSAGVASFADLSFGTKGAYKFKATLGAFTGLTGNFFIQPSNSKLVFLSQPNGVVAGANEGKFTVAVEDQLNNVDTTNNSIVTISIASGPDGATILGTATASAVKGIATFTKLALHTAGTYTLTAADAGLTSATSNSFIVIPAAAKSLQFVTQPSNVAVGQTMSAAITVKVVDAFGNLATADHSTVKLTVHSGPAVTLANASASAVSGIATLAALTLPTGGTYTLTAADGHLTSIVSNPFIVT